MMEYKEFEQKVYNWLSSKNNQDPNFTFSVRRQSAKGAEGDYFIGTKQSGYFATTFWTLPVAFPGSSGDCMPLIFRISDKGLNYHFEFKQTKHPHDAQNKSALNLCESLKEALAEMPGLYRHSPDHAKMFMLLTNPKRRNYPSVEEMTKDIDLELDHIIELVDKKITEEKKQNPDFVAHRITPEEFSSMTKKLQERIAKHENREDSAPVATSAKYWLYAPGENANKWNEFFDAGIMGLGWNHLGDLNIYSTKEEIASKLRELENAEGSKNNDAMANYDFKETISVGDIIIAKKGRREYVGYGIVTSDYFYDESRSDYQKCRKVDWKKKGSWQEDGTDIVLKTLTDITKYPEYVEKLISLIGIGTAEASTKQDLVYRAPINQILYGPPGTGKTYNTVLEAAKIVSGKADLTYNQALKIFNEKLKDQIEFITFHQNFSYEDFIQGLRPDTDNGSDLTFKKKDGVFKRIADRALENLELSKKAPEELSNEMLFDTALKAYKDSILDLEDKHSINETAYIFEIDEEAFRYTGTNWEKHANGIRMKFSDLKEFYKNNVQSRKDVKSLANISGLANQHATYYFLVYQQILKFLPKKLDRPSTVERKNYVIIIDEINRANISRVFGELITLIEEDKRAGGKIPMSVTLPSGDNFKVPSNLYIIGTMNTADKSISLLDIALRRRFEFVPMYPQYEIDGNAINHHDVLRELNERICKERTRDFQIGHAYFMENKSLDDIMNKKVIPLLLEYFMNDEKKVRDIISLDGYTVDTESWPMKFSKN